MGGGPRLLPLVQRGPRWPRDRLRRHPPARLRRAAWPHSRDCDRGVRRLSDRPVPRQCLGRRRRRRPIRPHKWVSRSARCGSELGESDVPVATTKQDDRDSSNPWSTARPRSGDCPVTREAAMIPPHPLRWLAGVVGHAVPPSSATRFGRLRPRCGSLADGRARGRAPRRRGPSDTWSVWERPRSSGCRDALVGGRQRGTPPRWGSRSREERSRQRRQAAQSRLRGSQGKLDTESRRMAIAGCDDCPGPHAALRRSGRRPGSADRVTPNMGYCSGPACAAAHSCARPGAPSVCGSTSTMASAGIFARLAAAMMASAEGAS